MSEINAVGNDKSMALALIMSVFVWGLGQLYQGRTKVGAIWIVTWIISIVLSFITVGLFAIVALVLWLVNLYDTYTVLFELD